MNTPTVQSGLDHLLSDHQRLERLKGRKIGLLVNPTSVNKDLKHAIEALQERQINIIRLFGPEHGVRADAQDMEAVDETIDPISGLPCVSLYGSDFESLRPKPADLDGLDLVICDIQDVGARYYTYVYTIGLMMDACGDAGVEVWVLDRPNPINGIHIEGNIVRDEFRSFVGMQPIATRHGMTPGELAIYFKRFGGWECELEVVPLRGWRRSMWYDETGLPWVMPSPNMPTLDTATVYPGQCLIEGTDISEARGTTRPFELFGAPFIDAFDLEKELNSFDLEGVAFRPTAFRPKFQKLADKTCRGLQIHITNRNTFRSLTVSYAILSAMLKLYRDRFTWRQKAYEFVADRLAIDLLLGDDALRLALEAGANPLELASSTQEARAEFEDQRAQCLLYHD